MTPPRDEGGRDGRGRVDFEALSSSALPPPPRPAILDSLAPVNYAAEVRAERARLRVAQRRRRAARRRWAGAAAAVVCGALLAIRVELGAGAPWASIEPPRDELAGAPAAAAAAPAASVPPSRVEPASTPAAPPPAAPAPVTPPAPEAGATPDAEARAPRGRRVVSRPRDRVVSTDPNLPLTPPRDAVVRALEAVRADVERCARGLPGVARMVVTVGASGAVRHAYVQGAFAGRAEGSCMARAVRHARFDPFRKEDFRVVYPYALQSR